MDREGLLRRQAAGRIEPVAGLLLDAERSGLITRIDRSVFDHALRQRGVGRLIDDFGAGFASFSRLRQLPVTGSRSTASGSKAGFRRRPRRVRGHSIK